MNCSFRYGFCKVFCDKYKIIFSSNAMINVEEFHYARLVSCAGLVKGSFQVTVGKCLSNASIKCFWCRHPNYVIDESTKMFRLPQLLDVMYSNVWQWNNVIITGFNSVVFWYTILLPYWVQFNNDFASHGVQLECFSIINTKARKNWLNSLT